MTPLIPQHPGLFGIIGHDPEDGPLPVLEFYIRDHPEMLPWNWCYFHGSIEHHVAETWERVWAAMPASQKDPGDDGWCAPDLVSANIPLDDIADGVWECTVYGKPAVVYIWTAIEGQYRPRGLGDLRTRRHAYIVDPASPHDVEHAQEKYLARASML